MDQAINPAVLTLSCPDQVGVVECVSGLLARNGHNIVESQQFVDPETRRFFMRVESAGPVDVDRLRTVFATAPQAFELQWELHAREERSKFIVMVSKFGHCLNDLLYRWSVGSLHGDIASVVSNHPDLSQLVQTYDIPFHHIPITVGDKAGAEAELMELVSRYDADLVVLARYMQVLSDDLCQKMSGRIINIHHSFLPSFKGAMPYHQAHRRGVKLIGATAHYVTPDLDEGPIIDQDVARTDHRHTPDQMAAVGRDVESRTLARAVQWHLEHRVMRNANRTVIFA